MRRILLHVRATRSCLLPQRRCSRRTSRLRPCQSDAKMRVFGADGSKKREIKDHDRNVRPRPFRRHRRLSTPHHFILPSNLECGVARWCRGGTYPPVAVVCAMLVWCRSLVRCLCVPVLHDAAHRSPPLVNLMGKRIGRASPCTLTSLRCPCRFAASPTCLRWGASSRPATTAKWSCALLTEPPSTRHACRQTAHQRRIAHLLSERTL